MATRLSGFSWVTCRARVPVAFNATVLLVTLRVVYVVLLLGWLQVRAGATLRFPRTLPIDRDDPDAFKLQVHRLSLKTLW